MHNRDYNLIIFKKEFIEFLAKYNINATVKYANEILVALAGVDEFSRAGMGLENLSEDDIDLNLCFQIPKGTSWREMNKLFKLFNYSIDDYAHGSSLIINPTFFAKNIVPLIEDHVINAIKVSSPRLKQFRHITESVTNINDLINASLSGYAINTKSDVFEYAILTMADITTKPAEVHFSTFPKTSPDRFKLELIDITADDAKKLCTYFRKLGDDSLIATRSSRDFQTSDIVDRMCTVIYRNVFVFDIACEIIATKILPKIHEIICYWEKHDPDLLDGFRQHSRAQKTAEEPKELLLQTVSDKPLGLFYNKNKYENVYLEEEYDLTIRKPTPFTQTP